MIAVPSQRIHDDKDKGRYDIVMLEQPPKHLDIELNTADIVCRPTNHVPPNCNIGGPQRQKGQY